MIVIPPRDPNEQYPADPAAEALGKLYEQFTNVQNLAEFHAALRKRDALYELQHKEMGDNPENFESLHPRDFYRQFDRRADDDDKTVVSEAPYRIRQQLRDVLAPERDTALGRAKETYKQLFIDRQLAQLDEDRQYYFRKLADAASDGDRERYLTALIGRLKLSGDVGLLYKDDADRLIENIPSDLDIFNFNREFASDPARAQRLLLYGAYPNIRPELRGQLVKEAEESVVPLTANAPDEEVNPERSATIASQVGADANAEIKEGFATEGFGEALRWREAESDSQSNNEESSASNDKDRLQIVASSADQADGTGDEQLAANAPTQSPKPAQTECPSLIGPVPVPGYTEKGRFSWRACNDQTFIDAANNYNRSYGLQADDPGYITPQMLKAWAIIENGDNKEKFLRDPFTANHPDDWDNAKTRITGLQRGEAMTPQKSARAALEWMRYKSFRPGGNGTLAGGLRNYSGGTDLHDAPSRKPYFDYHPGVEHREWYPAAILGLEAKMLGMVTPQMD